MLNSDIFANAIICNKKCKYSLLFYFLEFYGFMPWVLIQRVTLPLAVFYRFHSAVVSIELCKEVYSGNSTETEEKMFEEMAEFPSNRLNEDDDVHKVPVPEY